MRPRSSLLAVVAGLLAAALTAGAALPAAAASARRASATVSLGRLYIEGAGRARTAVVGNGGRIRIIGGYRERYSGSPVRPHLVLERASGHGWHRVGGVAVQKGYLYSARTPAVSTSDASRTFRYRVVSVRTSAVGNTSASAPVSVVVEDQDRYTGLAQTIWQYAKPYCPNTAVHVRSLPAGEAGDYETGALLIRISDRVGSDTVVQSIDQRALALHECSHERQWLDYGGSNHGYRVMKRAAKRYFSTWHRPAGVTTPYPYHRPSHLISPIEHAADCGAQAVNPGGYLGYGGYCTAGELKRGARLLSGGRY